MSVVSVVPICSILEVSPQRFTVMMSVCVCFQLSFPPYYYCYPGLDIEVLALVCIVELRAFNHSHCPNRSYFQLELHVWLWIWMFIDKELVLNFALNIRTCDLSVGIGINSSYMKIGNSY